MPRKRSPYDGDLTRAALLDAAEQLFADEGVEATSIRSVNKAAGVAPAAVHYHFGSKDALVDAVLARRGEGVLARIVERADALAGRRRRPRSREIVECVAQPYLDLLDAEPDGGRRWINVVAQLSLAQDARMTLGQPAAERLRALCVRAHPRLDEDDVAPRLSLALNALIQMLGRSPLEPTSVTPDDFRAVLIEFVAGGLDSALKAAAPAREPVGRSA